MYMHAYKTNGEREMQQKSGSLKIKFSKCKHSSLTVGMINGSVVNHLFPVVMLCHYIKSDVFT